MAVRQVRDISTRIAAQVIERVRAQVLGVVLDTLDRHEDTLTRQGRIIRKLEARMGAVSDAIESFRAQVDAETSRIGEQLAQMQARLDSGDAGAAAEVSAGLAPVVESLRALGTGTEADPVPAPVDPEDPTEPAAPGSDF